MTMKIEIITTGDELMQGVIVDTNTPWIADRCHKLGCEVVRHSCVGDDAGRIAALLKEAGRRADVLIVTGGLGPTADDITVEVAARAFKLKLVENKAVLKGIREFFKRVGRPMSKSNDKQALIPKGGKVLKNLVGTAPGVQVKLGRAQAFFLPGVPKELYPMFEDSVVPYLSKRSKLVLFEKVLRCFGSPEATIDEKLKGLALGDVRLSFRVKFPEILLKLVCRAGDSKIAKKNVESVARQIRERLGDVVYGEGDEELAQVVGRLLFAKRMTIAIAESCTGGLICDTITNVPGASEYFERGAVSYSNKSKQELLGVAEDILRTHGAVSSISAQAMAEGVRKLSGASIGIGVTGIAGPGGGNLEKPVGTVYVAVATSKGVRSHLYHFNRDRVGFKQIVAWTALNLLRQTINEDKILSCI